MDGWLTWVFVSLDKLTRANLLVPRFADRLGSWVTLQGLWAGFICTVACLQINDRLRGSYMILNGSISSQHNYCETKQLQNCSALVRAGITEHGVDWATQLRVRGKPSRRDHFESGAQWGKTRPIEEKKSIVRAVNGRSMTYMKSLRATGYIGTKPSENAVVLQEKIYKYTMCAVITWYIPWFDSLQLRPKDNLITFYVLLLGKNLRQICLPYYRASAASCRRNDAFVRTILVTFSGS